MQKHVVCGSIQYGELPNFFDFASQTSESYPFKGTYFQKNPRDQKFKNLNFLKNVFFDIYIILGKNQILNKKSF